MNVTELILRAICYAVFTSTAVTIIVAFVFQFYVEKVEFIRVGNGKSAHHQSILENMKGSLRKSRIAAVGFTTASAVMYFIYTSLYGIFV